MFTDDTDCFYSYKNRKGLFYTVNSELEKYVSGLKPINYQLITRKLS